MVLCCRSQDEEELANDETCNFGQEFAVGVVWKGVDPLTSVSW